jgi:NAD(P)-dependent dehydrogenase (short-subunit alcohol dehydrogenase family)
VTVPPPQMERKEPVPRLRVPLLPPSARSRVALGLTAAAALGRFELQVCRACCAVQYPPREACHRCLSVKLDWQPQSGRGELISETTLFHSHDEFFRERLPWRLGMVRLDSGPTVIAHLPEQAPAAPARVVLEAHLDKAGQAALIAFPDAAALDNMTAAATNGAAVVAADSIVANMSATPMRDDRRLREMTCDPRFRNVLVTDGGTPVGAALARALIGAGADRVWLGYTHAWKDTSRFQDLAHLKQVTLLPLDLTRADSVEQAAEAIGAQLDILINNAELRDADGVSARTGIDSAIAEMEVSYFGLLRLAQEFGAVMRSRAAGNRACGAAWVNLLSVYALASVPERGAFCAAKAAAYSLSQCLRAQMQPAGVRVINLFPGPIDDERSQELPPPKVAPEALARAIVKALQDGVEDVYPGDVAQEWFARWRENPKVLERELAMGR